MVGLQELLDECSDPQGLAGDINRELMSIWQATSGVDPRATQKLQEVERKIENMRKAMEEGFESKEDFAWAKTRLQQLNVERERLLSAASISREPERMDIAEAMKFRRNLDHTFALGSAATKNNCCVNL